MLTDGKHLFVEAAGLKDVINASRHGQLAMRDLIGLHLRRVEWDKDGFVARLYPLPVVSQDKLDRLDEAFLFERSIDIYTYDRHAEKLRLREIRTE